MNEAELTLIRTILVNHYEVIEAQLQIIRDAIQPHSVTNEEAIYEAIENLDLSKINMGMALDNVEEKLGIHE